MYVNFSFLILLTLLVQGCSPSVEDQLKDYTVRVSRVLETEIKPHALSPRPYQASQSNRINLATQTIDLLDFLKLNRCELGKAIAKRNTILGKVAAPSQVMHFDRDFLLLAPACIDQLKESNPTLSQQLEQAFSQKYQDRLNIWWNAWTSFEEWQSFTTIAATPIEIGTESAHLSLSLQALDFAIQQGHTWNIGKNLTYDEQEMENHLKQLRFSESLGRWLASIVILNKTLTETASILEANHDLCYLNKNNPKAKVLFTVFQKFYAGKIQPYLSKNYKYGEALVNRLNKMAHHVQPPESFNIWLTEVYQLKQTMEQNNHRHIQAWQAVLSSCGLMPSHPTTPQN